MQTFEWIDATSVEQAATLLGKSDNIAKAGGMDILDLMKEGILKPSRVVNLRTIEGLDGLNYSDSRGLTMGPLVTLARIAASPEIRKHYPALADAARHAATPQVRNAATMLVLPQCAFSPGRRIEFCARWAKPVSRDFRQPADRDGAGIDTCYSFD